MVTSFKAYRTDLPRYHTFLPLHPSAFRFHLTMDTLAVQLYISHSLGMFRTFTCESAPMARKRNVRRQAHTTQKGAPS